MSRAAAKVMRSQRNCTNSYLGVKQWQKIVDPYIFLCGSLYSDTFHAVFLQLQILYGMGVNCSVVVDHIAKRSGEVTAKLITEVVQPLSCKFSCSTFIALGIVRTLKEGERIASFLTDYWAFCPFVREARFG
jgi:hypothetical protein